MKDPVLWACLAGLAVHSKQLDTAEVAYAAIQEADKVTKKHLVLKSHLSCNKDV